MRWMSAFPLILFTACAPKPLSIPRDPGIVQTGPRLNDVDLGLDQKPIGHPQFDFTSDVSGASAFRLVENALVVQDGLAPSAKIEWTRSFLASLPHDRVSLAAPHSPFIDLLVERSQDDAKTLLDDVIPRLNSAPARVRQILAGLPAPGLNFDNATAALHSGFRFLNAFDAAIASSDLYAPVITAIRAKTAAVIGQRAQLEADARRFNAATRIGPALDALASVMSDLGYTPSAALVARLKRGQALGAEIDRFQGTHGALAVLIDVWSYLDPAERASYFQAENADLYDYLNGMSATDLACLKDDQCSSLPQWLAKTVVIYPKLESYGLERIRTMLNSKGADSVRTQAMVEIKNQLQALPATIGDRIEQEIQAQSAPILALAANFSQTIRARVNAWAARTIEKDGPSIYDAHPTKARVHVGSDGRVQLSWLSGSAGASSMENAGSLLSLMPVLWNQSDINPADARALMLSNVTSLAHDYEAGAASSSADDATVTARGFAEAVRGYASLAIAFRETEHNAFDDSLGGFTARELFPEFNSTQVADALDQPIFPKPAFYALSFRSLADRLKAATGEHAQVFLIDANNRVTLVNEEDSEDAAPAVMAGIADRENDQLAATVRSEDVARYLIAMCDVLEATRLVERSTSEYLTTPGADGVVPRDEIVQSRERIRMLILGLANYLSHQFRAGGELIQHELVIATQRPYTATISVLDQALTIRALVAASDVLGTDVYRWEAVDLVSAMNRLLFRADLGFYARSDEKAISPLVLLETLRSLDAVDPYLTAFSRRQIAALTGPWRQTVAGWKLQF